MAVTVTFLRAEQGCAVVRVGGMDGHAPETFIECANKHDIDGALQPRLADPDSTDHEMYAAHDLAIAEYERSAVLESPEEAATRWAMAAYGVGLILREVTLDDKINALLAANPAVAQSLGIDAKAL